MTDIPETLPPCPFCGLPGDEIELVKIPPDDVMPLRFQVYCDGCGSQTANQYSEQSAIAAWNRRAAQAERMARLEEALRDWLDAEDTWDGDFADDDRIARAKDAARALSQEGSGPS